MNASSCLPAILAAPKPRFSTCPPSKLPVFCAVVKGTPRPLIEVLNKIDCLDAARHDAIVNTASRETMTVATSALTGEGVDHLLALIDTYVIDEGTPITFDLLPSEGEALAWLYENGQVRQRDTTDDGLVTLEVVLPDAEIGRLEKRFPKIAVRHTLPERVVD